MTSNTYIQSYITEADRQAVQNVLFCVIQCTDLLEPLAVIIVQNLCGLGLFLDSFQCKPDVMIEGYIIPDRPNLCIPMRVLSAKCVAGRNGHIGLCLQS